VVRVLCFFYVSVLSRSRRQHRGFGFGSGCCVGGEQSYRLLAVVVVL